MGPLWANSLYAGCFRAGSPLGNQQKTLMGAQNNRVTCEVQPTWALYGLFMSKTLCALFTENTGTQKGQTAAGSAWTNPHEASTGVLWDKSCFARMNPQQTHIHQQ